MPKLPRSNLTTFYTSELLDPQFQRSGLRVPGAERALADRLAGKVAFLRHRVDGLEHRESSDWDLAVRDAQEAGWKVDAMFGRPLITVPKRFVTQRYFCWGQVDLLPAFEWQGIPYLSAGRFWVRVATHGDGLPRPCIAHDAFIAWMTGLLWGGHYSRRHDGLIARAAAEDPDELESCLTEAFGRGAGMRLMAMAGDGDAGRAVRSVRRLRTLLWIQAVTRDASSILMNQARHWRTEIGHHVRTPFPWIAVLGPDGSGKSTVIEGLCERLLRSRIGVMESHWWPEPRKAGEVAGPAVTDPHAAPPRGTVLSVAKTLWICARWWRARAGPVGHALSKRAMLVSDRYFDDLRVDPRRYRYGAPVRLARWMFRFLPRPDRVLFLLGDPGVVHARKQEVPLAELRRQMVGYRELAAELGSRARVIDATLPAERVVDQAWQAVFHPEVGGK